MPAKDLSRFELLVREHRSALHAVFACLESAALNDTLSPDAYRLFSVNIAVRTMLSLPEIHACCIQASLDLDPLRTAYSVMTGAEEGGFGKPSKVHTVLMMNALNHHGAVVFGLPALNLRQFMALVRLIYLADQCRSLLDLKTISNPSMMKRLGDCGLFNSAEIFDTCRCMAAISGIQIENAVWDNGNTFERLIQLASARLAEAHVLQQTVDYCLAQLVVLGRMRAGYLQGVGFAHEALADGMVYKMFRIMYAQVSKYPSRADFVEKVYPYYSAHGNYMEMYHGEKQSADGVEVVHAKRELAKLAQLDDDSLDAAWVGANHFADRNVRIWDGLLQTLGSKRDVSNEGCDQTAAIQPYLHP